jgi:Putative MetA-pathway of phenol degradation
VVEENVAKLDERPWVANHPWRYLFSLFRTSGLVEEAPRRLSRCVYVILILADLLAFLPLAEAQVLQPGPTSPPSAEEPKSGDQRLLFDLFRPIVGNFPVERKRKDLTFGNFFSYGWDVAWTEPEEGPDDAPRFRLMRIQRAFWEREVRIFSPYAFGTDGGTADELEIEMEIELPVNRRFLIEFEPALKGVGPYGSPWTFAAGDLLVIPQAMLYETKNTSFSSGLSVRVPTGSQSVGSGRTSLAPYLAWWADLGQRMSLHTYFGAEFPLAGYGPGRPNAIFQYAAALAKTVTPKKTPWFGNLTFFAELNGTTGSGGPSPSTTVTLLPGVRWLMFRDFWLAAGYELPLTTTRQFDGRVWFSIYRDF